MAENKNRAVEKADNVLDQPTHKENKKRSSKNVKKSSKKHDKAKAKNKVNREEVKKQKQLERAKRRQDLAEKKAKKEREVAQKRVEKARIKAHKKAEKEKAKASVMREKNRKKEERRQTKLRIKEQREQAKQNRKEKRQNNRQKNKEQGRSFGGWLAAVISLGVTTLVLASALTFVFLMPKESDMMLEAGYQKSFYDTVEQVDNIDLNLSKVLATKDAQAMQIYLLDTAINSELAENDLQQLPLKDESKFYTTKLINQIGDFSKYLNKKLVNGDSLTEQDRAGLVQLYQANASLKAALQRIISKIGTNYSFNNLANAKDGDLVLDNFNELQNLSVEYPELIYDGPFSDGVDRTQIKGLSGEQISKTEATGIFSKIFENYQVTMVEDAGESQTKIECYNITAMLDGQPVYAQISKVGGKLIMFDYAGNCEEVNYSLNSAIEKAQEFLVAQGLKDLSPVWDNLSNNVYTINFAYKQNKVIVYPDLVKVRVCADTGMVLGMEASSYYTNHTERLIASPSLSVSQAEENLSTMISVKSSALALVPIGNSTEKLCYEFMGEYDGSTYYVYIDAMTGRQVEMFKVIDSNEGSLLM